MPRLTLAFLLVQILSAQSPYPLYGCRITPVTKEGALPGWQLHTWIMPTPTEKNETLYSQQPTMGKAFKDCGKWMDRYTKSLNRPKLVRPVIRTLR